MASKWTHIKHGVLIATGITITGTSLYMGADRLRVEPVDVAVLSLAAAERLIALQEFLFQQETTVDVEIVFPVYENANAAWFDYETQTYSAFVQPSGELETNTIIKPIYDAKLFGYNRSVIEKVETGGRVIWSGWETITVDGIDAEYDGVYHLTDSGSIYTNMNSRYLVIGKESARFAINPAFGGISSDGNLAHDFHLLTVQKWNPGNYTPTITVSESVITNRVYDNPQFAIEQYDNVFSAIGVAAQKVDVRSIDLASLLFYGYSDDALFNQDTTGQDLGLTGASTTDEIISAFHSAAIEVMPIFFMSYNFVNAQTNASFTSEELLVNWFDEFGINEYGTNYFYISDNKGFTTGGHYTNSIYPRPIIEGLRHRYDAIQKLGSTTMSRAFWNFGSNNQYTWTGTSTNSISDAISNATNATPTTATVSGGVVGPAKYARVILIDDDPETWRAQFVLRRAKATTDDTGGLFVLPKNINKSVSFYTYIKQYGDGFYSEEGYIDQTFQSATSNFPIAITTNSFYDSEEWFPPSEIEPNINYFPDTIGTNGWVASGRFTPAGETGAFIVLKDWEFEYAIDPIQ